MKKILKLFLKGFLRYMAIALAFFLVGGLIHSCGAAIPARASGLTNSDVFDQWLYRQIDNAIQDGVNKVVSQYTSLDPTELKALEQEIGQLTETVEAFSDLYKSYADQTGGVAPNAAGSTVRTALCKVLGSDEQLHTCVVTCAVGADGRSLRVTIRGDSASGINWTGYWYGTSDTATPCYIQDGGSYFRLISTGSNNWMGFLSRGFFGDYMGAGQYNSSYSDSSWVFYYDTATVQEVGTTNLTFVQSVDGGYVASSPYNTGVLACKRTDVTIAADADYTTGAGIAKGLLQWKMQFAQDNNLTVEELDEMLIPVQTVMPPVIETETVDMEDLTNFNLPVVRFESPTLNLPALGDGGEVFSSAVGGAEFWFTCLGYVVDHFQIAGFITFILVSGFLIYLAKR